MAQPSVIYYVAPERVTTVQEKIVNVSKYYGIEPDIPLAIAEAESDFINVCNKEIGCFGGIGVFQIVQSTFDEQCRGDVYDMEDNIFCGVRMIANREFWRWRPSAEVWTEILGPAGTPYECSCIKTARHYGADIPLNTNAEDLYPNTTPHEGAVALFRYGPTAHAGTMEAPQQEGFWMNEGNLERCRKTRRFIKWTDSRLIGFSDGQM